MNKNKYDNYKRVSEEEIRSIQLCLLDYFVLFCDNHQLKYYLAYGTLLGAVRHKGFIPWDDDIDIFMPRADYEQFLQLFQNNDRFTLFSLHNNRYIYAFSKLSDNRTILIEKNMSTNILGINIDIFPLDFVCDNDDKRIKAIKKIKKLHYMEILSSRKIYKHHSLLKTITCLLLAIPLKIIGYRYFLRKIDRLIKKETSGPFVGNMSIDTYLAKEKYDVKWFLEGKKILFEGKEYCVPSNYENVLSTTYGDYMVPPPLEKRKKTHDNVAFWIDKRKE